MMELISINRIYGSKYFNEHKLCYYENIIIYIPLLGISWEKKTQVIKNLVKFCDYFLLYEEFCMIFMVFCTLYFLNFVDMPS